MQILESTAFDLDFFHSILPEEYGGMGQNLDSLCIVLENICREDSSLGGIIFTTCSAHEILLAAKCDAFLKDLTENVKNVYEFLIAAPVFNDPSDIEPSVKAEKKGDQYELNGTQEYCVLGEIAKYAPFPARTTGDKKYSFFIVNLSEAGLEKSRPIHSLGLHACPAVDITIKNVPAKLVGKEGEGALYFDKMFSRLSVAAAAMSLGIMKGSFKEAHEYAKKRNQGGRKIFNWSELRMMFADMAIDIKNAELAVSRTCMAMEQSESGWEESSMAVAIKIQNMACRIATDGIQVMGGVGYMKDFGQEKRYRDAKHIQTLFGMTPRKKLRYLDNIL